MAIREAEDPSMIKLVRAELALGHREKAKRLIREAQRARMRGEPGDWPSLDEIARTQQINKAMTNLARLIDEVSAPDECSSLQVT